ncbi:leucine--tRNA ligase [Ranunculus cassubicifolius]
MKEIDVKKKNSRRDRLREIDAKARSLWEEGDVFRSESRVRPPVPGEKFFGNFPCPYMNGYLDLGHAFSLSKVEFAAAYHRLRGANVLLPFAFHCTGMPIKVGADNLAREVEEFCLPPSLESAHLQEESDTQSLMSKVPAKTNGPICQWEIMRHYGLSDEEILKFRDPYHWLTFFPPLAMEDLKAFGLGCDWRRSFITTDMNPFYDSFVKWQVRKLKEAGMIVKSKRYTIYCPHDNKPCADHDRTAGEGVLPQEYTLIKMEVIPPLPPKLKFLEGMKVFLTAATLRPETMYGQTNCWVLPDGKYGAFEINETEVFIVTERAALNMAYQNLSRIPGKPTCLVELMGYDLIGLPLKSPLTFYEVIYSLPMLTISADKGTGIVSSVPSDSPDDYVALRDLNENEDLRDKYNVREEWLFPIIPIISIPEYGNISAEKICMDRNIKSQLDKGNLAEAKRSTYLKGYTEGIMLVGEHKGMKVQDAKRLVMNKLLETRQGVLYSEPENKVISRSGDQCVVALTDQWYITYGEPGWKEMAEECLASMNLYCDRTRHGIEQRLSSLKLQPCSTTFGMGSRIPWDEKLFVESLSESTIYMAYYTIAHILQNGDMYGSDTSLVKPEQMTDEVWNFVFCNEPFPKSSDIHPSLLNKMKQEFEYWYPFDLRVSGKDLIQNHLLFCIFNHTALLNRRHWPRGFRCNGNLTINFENMSKLTLRNAIKNYSADATRFALADAGDTLDDANFVYKTANDAIQKLTKELSWIEENLAVESSLRTGPPSTFADHVFENEMNIAVTLAEEKYNEYKFREALKVGFYDLQVAKDDYQFSCSVASKEKVAGMNRNLVWRFMDVQTRLIAPICPHYAEYVWKELLKKDGFVVNIGWPFADLPDPVLKRVNKYLKDLIVTLKKLLDKKVLGSAKKNTKSSTATPMNQEEMPKSGLIYVNEHYDGWREVCLWILRSKFNTETCTFAPDKEIIGELQKTSVGKDGNFKQFCMPFLKEKKAETLSLGVQALDMKLPFGEEEVLRENLELIQTQLGLERLEVISVSNDGAGQHVELLRNDPPSPGRPTAIFLS